MKEKLLTKSKVLKHSLFSLVASASVLAMQAHAALDSTVVDAIKVEVTADIGIAVAAGFAILAVSLASSVGMSLLGRFISKGANGG